MTAKFKQIIDQLHALITFMVDRSMSDEDFIANIDAINLLCNLYDDLKLDRPGNRKRMSRLYPELTRRIYDKQNIQYAVPLIKALNNVIYGGAEDYGPARWRNSLTEMCCKVADSYRENPLIDSTDYLFALDAVCYMSDDADNEDIEEYKEVISTYLEDIDGARRLYQIGYTIYNTTKTRGIFEINKGVGIIDGANVNSKMSKEQRRVPFTNMIYIADGPSDVPAFSVVKGKGGCTFAIYPKGDNKAFCQVVQLREDGRIDMFAEADYTEGTTAFMWITNKIKQIYERIKTEEQERRKVISSGPKHLV